jgi:hypothetical protein
MHFHGKKSRSPPFVLRYLRANGSADHDETCLPKPRIRPEYAASAQAGIEPRTENQTRIENAALPCRLVTMRLFMAKLLAPEDLSKSPPVP